MVVDRCRAMGAPGAGTAGMQHSIVRPVGLEMNFLTTRRAMQTGAHHALALLSPILPRLPALVPLGGRPGA
ncbi:hypothetical protein DRB87_08585 [Pandoraea sp. XY-2]|nr:hypothetical protein DRB87_08585 [Pandoraea sp. XY-2]